jgi:hypothetical protein
MTAIGHDTRFASSDRGVRLSRMRVPWTRGATSGVLLVILGAWAAIVPFIGPYLNFAYTPSTNTAWIWTESRGWFEVAPGAAAFAGGLLLLTSTNRAVAILGSWLGIAGGAWLIVGPSLTDVLNKSIGTPDPASSTNVQALEELFFFYGVGALILFVASVALGRLSVHSIRDVAVAERRAAAADTAAVGTAAEADEYLPAAAPTSTAPVAGAPEGAHAAPPSAPVYDETQGPYTPRPEPTYRPPNSTTE